MKNKKLIKKLFTINYLVSKLEDSISLTGNEIRVYRKMKPTEYDDLYLIEQGWVSKLKCTSLIYFDELYEHVQRLSGLHSQYWGFQRMILGQQDTDNRHNLTNEITRISNETRKVTRKIEDISRDILLSFKINSNLSDKIFRNECSSRNKETENSDSSGG
jgi:hypothetical protein